MLARVNLFFAWFMMLQIFFRNGLTIAGVWLLGTLGMPALLSEKFGWLAGAMFLFFALLIARHLMGELLPGVGKPEGKGYKLGHRVLFISSALAFGVFILPVIIDNIRSEGFQVMISMFLVDFMYMSLAVFGVGISLVYQSAQPASTTPNLNT
jgi:hypothetical protein